MLIPAALLLLSVSFVSSFDAEDVDTLLSTPKALPDELPLAVVWEDSLSTTDVVSLTTPVSLSVPVATDFLVVNTRISVFLPFIKSQQKRTEVFFSPP